MLCVHAAEGGAQLACQIEERVIGAGKVEALGRAEHVVQARDHPGQGTGRLAVGQRVLGGIQLARLCGGTAIGLGQGVHVRPCPFQRPQPARRIRQPIRRIGTVLCRVTQIEQKRGQRRGNGDQATDHGTNHPEAAEQLRGLL